MGAPYPRLYGGLGTTQGIWDTTTSPVVDVGTRASLEDGRVFYYARAGAANIASGKLLSSETVSGDMDYLAVNTALVGDITMDITPVNAKVFTANSLAGGYVVVHSDSANVPRTFRIASNPLTVLATEFTVTLTDPLPVSLDAAATVTVVKNPWMDVVISPTGTAHQSVGVPQVDIDATEYGWVQTWGVSHVWHDLVNATGDKLASGTATAGQVDVAAGAGEQPIGINLFTSVVADYGPVFLTIAP